MDGEILVLGGSSYVGKHMLARPEAGQFTATYAENPVPGAIQFDCTVMRLAEALGDLARFDSALLLLGDTQPDSCVRDPRRSHAVNVEGIERAIDDLLAAGVRVIFISSEFVFDGRQGQYSESDSPNPILLYGEQKLAIERYLESVTDDYAVLRLAKVYGGAAGDGTLFTNWLQAIERGGRLKCASDQYFSPIHVDDVVQAMLLAAASRIRGVFHLAGPDGLSRMECLQALLAEVRKLKMVELETEPCGINDFEFPEKRPLDVSMRIDKLTSATDFSPRRVTDFCRQLVVAEFASAGAWSSGGAA